MNILLLVIIMLYQIIETIFSVKEINEIKEDNITEKVKIKLYRESIIYGWIPVIIIFIFIILKFLSLNDIGLKIIKFSSYNWLNIIIIVIMSMLSFLLLYQMIMFLISKKYREIISKQINKKNQSNNHYDYVINNIMIPRTIKEKVWFSFVSLTAGICEEITWRGTLIFLLQNIFPMLNIVLVIIIASIIFGIFHSYQGIKGVIKTGLIGGLFNLLYIVSDSLILGIIFHFLFDFSSAFILTDKK